MKKYLYQGKNLEIEFEINDWAERSLISLLTRSKDTVILTTVNLGKEMSASDFLPLTVDYEEKFYAGGKIFGSRFVRREGRPSITSILNARLIDRSLRPLFSSNFRYQIQIVNILLSYDPQVNPAVLALLGSSFALSYLKIPWQGPVAGLSLGLTQDGWQINHQGNLNNGVVAELFVSATKNKINMLEFEGIEIQEKEILKGIEIAFEEIKKIVQFIEKNSQTASSELVQIQLDSYVNAEKLLDEFLKRKNIDLRRVLFAKQEGGELISKVFEEINNEDFGEEAPYVPNIFNQRLKKVFHKVVLEEKIRPDGRKLDEIRSISAEIDLFKRVHGSALFKRGLTHILSTVTLSSPGEELMLREVEYEGLKHFIHHYNFPFFSTGEIGSSKGPSRREIGHGELAEKSLRNLLPSQEDFPYTIRVVSEVLSSNGSTSMGSVCASSLALMAAGVPIKKHIAGISCGLVYENDKNFEILTDIQGPEDFLGVMDFKVAGTYEGVTAIQLDVKIEGLNLKQIEEVLARAKIARKQVLDYMNSIINQPRKNLSFYAPKIEIFQIDPLKIGLVIGAGGRTINEIIANTQVKIDIQPDGKVYIIGDNLVNIALAKNWIKIIADALKIGDRIKGKVVKILPSGAIIELAPQKTAFLHISEIADKKIENIENEIKIGEEYEVLVKNIDEEGKIYVSLKNVR